MVPFWGRPWEGFRDRQMGWEVAWRTYKWILMTQYLGGVHETAGDV
jgi:hypothetical protein